MENLHTLYNIGVPCKAKDSGLKATVLQNYLGNFYFNSDCFIRQDPEGFLIIPPVLFPPFFYLLGRFSDFFNNSRLLIAGSISSGDLEKLLTNKVLLIKKNNNQNKNKLSRVAIHNLPVQALLEVTSACNCQCLACYYGKNLDNSYPDLIDLKKRIDKLKKLGIGLVEVTGGEPFLRSDLVEILDYLNAKDIFYHIVTNGEFLVKANQDLIDSLKRCKGVAVSLDGYGFKHDLMRRRPGLFSKILLGLNLLKQNGIKFILVSTLNKKNEDSIEEMIALANKYDCVLHIRPTIYTGSASLNDLQNFSYKKISQYFNNPNVRNGFVSERALVRDVCYYGCGLRSRIAIDTKGLVYPCVMDRTRNIGNIKNFDQKGIFDSLKKEAIYFLHKNKKCKECNLVKKHSTDPLCSGFCRFSKAYNHSIK